MLLTKIKEKVQRAYRRGGVFGVTAKPIRLVANILYDRKELLFLKRPLDIPIPSHRTVLPTVAHEIGIETFEKLDFVTKERIEYCKRYLSMGCRCYAGVAGETIVGFFFVAFSPIREEKMGFMIQPEPGQVYQFDGEVAKEFRGKSIAVDHMANCWKLMRDMGYSETICFIDRSNRVSSRFHKRLDFTPFKIGTYRRIMFFKNIRYSAWDPARDSF
jgi:ribosomal protein S18 acetylase RimI-like enzyme